MKKSNQQDLENMKREEVIKIETAENSIINCAGNKIGFANSEVGAKTQLMAYIIR